MRNKCFVFLVLVTVSWFGAVAIADEATSPWFHTRSIAACDPVEMACGVAVVSFPTGVPAIVPVGQPGVAVANQATPSLTTARVIVDEIVNGGLDAPTALTNALALDPFPQFRQFGVAALYPNASGVTVANYVGADNPPEFCSELGDTYAVQANLQSSADVCHAMATAFDSATGSLARRLLEGLKAGTPVGNDARGEYSASVRVFSNTWLLADFTELKADAHVNRSANWEEDLSFDLTAYLGMLVPADERDLVELTRDLGKQIQRALKNLGFYQGPVNGYWSDEAEQALFDFEVYNLFFLKTTVEIGGQLLIDGPLAEYIIVGEPRGVLTPAP